MSWVFPFIEECGFLLKAATPVWQPFARKESWWLTDYKKVFGEAQKSVFFCKGGKG